MNTFCGLSVGEHLVPWCKKERDGVSALGVPLQKEVRDGGDLDDMKRHLLFWGSCEEVLLSCVGQNKQHKHGGWEAGARGPGALKPTESCRNSGQAFGPPPAVVECRGEPAICRNLGKGSTQQGYQW